MTQFITSCKRNIISFIDAQPSSNYTYEYYLKDHLGNTRVMFHDDGSGNLIADQTNNYYPFGMLFAKENIDKNKFLYNGKELQEDVFNGVALDWYDFGARMYDAALGRFHVQDAFAEKYNDFTPYHYGANNPMLYIDINGDSLQVAGKQTAIDIFNDINTQAMGGYYETSVDENGNVSINKTDKEGEMDEKQGAYYNAMNMIVSDEKTTSVEVVENDDEVIIGDMVNALIDVTDVQKLGEGNISAAGAMIHEVSEQYFIQAKGHAVGMKPHIMASGVESGILGCSRDPMSMFYPTKGNYSTKKNIGFIEVKVGNSVVYIDIINNNVTNVTGNDR